MKKAIMVLVCCLVLALTMWAAEEKKIKEPVQHRWSFVGALGAADSGFDNVMVDIGVEFRASRNVAFQLVANNHFSDRRRYYDPFYYPYGGGFFGYSPGNVSVGLDANALHGISLYSVYRFSLSEKWAFFTKAGLNVTFYSRWEPSETVGYYEKYSKNGLAGAAGMGLELALSKRAGLLLGSTYKRFIREISNLGPDDPSAGLDWFKFYVGLYYRFK
jgi:hypothetical protein